MFKVMGYLQHAPLFRHRHFPDDVIILALRWYLRFSLSYRDLKTSWPSAASPFTTDVASAKLFLRKAMANQRRAMPQEIVVDGNPTLSHRHP